MLLNRNHSKSEILFHLLVDILLLRILLLMNAATMACKILNGSVMAVNSIIFIQFILQFFSVGRRGYSS